MAALESPQVQQTIAETRALGALLALSSDATALVRAVFEQYRPADVDGWLRHCAMAHVLGERIFFPDDLTSEGDAADQLFVRTAQAWMLWSVGRFDEARTCLTTFCEPAIREGSEIHMMALGPWCHAVGALLREDWSEARRYFRRATEVGSQLGTETNNAIQWAYAATFFDHKP